MSRWRALARIIALSDGGCFVVFPSYNWRIAVFVPTLPPGLEESSEINDLPVRRYAMIAYRDSDTPPHELEPEWCP